MITRRINKQMAADAAKKIVDIRYGQAINDIDEKVKNFSDSLLKKYIPQPVLSVINEFEQHFEFTQYFSVFYRVYDVERGREVSSSSIPLKSNIKLPRRNNYLVVSENDYREAKKLIEMKRQICDLSKKTEDELTEIIRSCNTENTLMKRYPDIHPYIEWPPVKALPANVTADWVNNLMSDIKKSNELFSNK